MNKDKKTNNKKAGKVLRFERDGGFFARRADSKRLQNDPVSAAKLYWAAIEKSPEDLDLRLALADVLSDMQRFAVSNRVLIPHMHEDDYFLKEAYCRVGFNFFSMGEYIAAKRCFDSFFDLTDEVSERTDVILDALDFMDSIMDGGSGLEDAAEADFNTKHSEAQRCMSGGDYEKARRLLEQLHSDRPEDRRVCYDLALACMCSRDYKQGIAHIDSLLGKDPDDISALCLKLIFARNAHDEVMVNSICNQIARCDPDLPEELVPIIGVILDAGKNELALTLAKRVYKRTPFDCISNHVLALCYIKLKRYAVAAKLYDRLLCIDKNDCIAAFYRTKCTEDPKSFENASMDNLAHYQLPVADMMQNVRMFTELDFEDKDMLLEKWRNDPYFKNSVRWGFTLKDFSISYGMLSILRAIGDDAAEQIIRESIIDPDTNPTFAHEALGILKSLDAKEPYFAFINGNLLEGRVNMVDVSARGVPRQYRLIYPRFNTAANGLYDFEVYAAASAILEGFLASLKGKYPQIDEKRSAALSAALECAACRKCGVDIKEDLLERYGVSERRLKNAFDRLLSSVLTFAENDTEDDE